ncbi:MAG TPA: hypothetical protein VFQ05_03625 [Candidatus Eisenbacteria bacterium]|nr:hypothetical protein [Candidatus Eisenbacteria bacterium]
MEPLPSAPRLGYGRLIALSLGVIGVLEFGNSSVSETPENTASQKEPPVFQNEAPLGERLKVSTAKSEPPLHLVPASADSVPVITRGAGPHSSPPSGSLPPDDIDVILSSKRFP